MFSPKPRKWTYLDWYNQIMRATSYKLKINEKTIWVNISDSLKSAIENSRSNEE
ncbi:MAG: hypothetical protein HRT43_11295 [Campylobacteraceae bacterium]|nr:hypothetical protein [Campylobacteraceae bacterium]